MTDTIEEKWPKGVAASIAFLFIIIIGLGTLAPNSLIDKVMLKEREWGNALLTQGDMDIIVGRTSSIYTSVVIDSGAKEIVSELFMPRGNGTVDGQPAEFGKNRTLRRPICLRASALKRRVSRASETRAKVQRHRRS